MDSHARARSTHLPSESWGQAQHALGETHTCTHTHILSFCFFSFSSFCPAPCHAMTPPLVVVGVAVTSSSGWRNCDVVMPSSHTCFKQIQRIHRQLHPSLCPFMFILPVDHDVTNTPISAFDLSPLNVEAASVRQKPAQVLFSPQCHGWNVMLE